MRNTISSLAHSFWARLLFAALLVLAASFVQAQGLPGYSNYNGSAAVINTATPIPRSLVGGTAVIYGDSVGLGNGATAAPRSYGYLISNTMLWSLTNTSVSGTQLQDTGQANSMLAASISSASLSYFITGYNDMRAFGNGAGLTSYLHTLNNVMVWLSLPAASKVLGTNAAVTKTGTWATALNFGRNMEFSSTNGDTLTWTSPAATAVYIGALSNGAPNCNYSVSVDGGGQVSNVTEPSAVATVLGQTLGLYLIRIGGLAATTHSVVFTVGNSTRACFVDYFATNTGVSTTGPYLFLGNTIRMNATGYTLGSPNYNHGSDAIVTQYGTSEASAVSPLAADGLNITLVNDSAVYNPATQVSSDNIHPNDTGHLVIANAFLGQATIANQNIEYTPNGLLGSTAYDDFNNTYAAGLLNGALGSASIDTRNRRELLTFFLDGISALTSPPENMGGGPTFNGTHGWKECYVATATPTQNGCRGYGAQGTVYDMIPASGWYTQLPSSATPANDNATATAPDTASTFSVNAADGAIVPKGRTFATLPAYPNGTICYCSDCNSTCTAGASTGKWCQRVSAAWAVAF